MESNAVTADELPADAPGVLARLLSSRREFLTFLEGRVRSRAAAEEILQAAFARAVEKADGIEDSESAVAWFYRVLRNAVVDHYRRAAAEQRATERHLAESPSHMEPELKNAICGCMNTLLPTLKPEYADMIQRVDLEEASLADVATSLAITPNNATVRLHRARQALKRRLEQSCGACAEHGCLDCSCGSHTRRTP